MRLGYFAVIVCLFLASPTLGQEPEAQTGSGGQAGFAELPQFGGPESTAAQLRRGDELRDSLYDWPFFDMDLAVINWTQGIANGKAGYAAGRLAFDVYLDAFPFQTFSKGFLNRSFILNPTLPTTGVSDGQRLGRKHGLEIERHLLPVFARRPL